MSDARPSRNVTEFVTDDYAQLLAPAVMPGARVALVSPASPAKRDRVRDGADRLRELGYAPVLGRNCLGSGPLYFSGTVAERLDDLHAAFADPAVDAIICTRGGWGSAELLEWLDLDLIRAHPKPLLGYSDVTSLHTWIGQQTGLVTFHGPMVSPDFARLDGVDLASFAAALTGAAEWRVGAVEGLRLLRAPLGDGEATSVEGVLAGGCLSIFCEALGTQFAPVPREGTILFLEDVGTKPYQWDRMLLHLRYAGLLEGVRAIVFGDMGQCVSAAENGLLEAALLHALREFRGPICVGLRSGHVDGANVTLPLGVRVELGLGALDGPALRAVGPTVCAGAWGMWEGKRVDRMQHSKHIHLIGICGTAMASLAGMLQAQGHRVTGSDAAAYPPMSQLLASLQIRILEPYSERNLEPAPDLVVVGNAISRGNVELEAVLDRRIPMASMAALLHEEFLVGRESLVVAGTHGKTTTTSMLAWIYEVASDARPELAPSFLIGGVAENFGTSFRVRPTKPFLLEGDEYDTAFFDKGPKFLHYFPDAAILTHVEFDHADIYADLAAVKTAFKRLVNLIPRRGRLVAFDGSENVTECVAKAFCAVERYGFAEGSHWQLRDLRHERSTSHWRLLRAGLPFAELSLPMAGAHNALNASAAAALAAGQGISAEAIATALGSFRSVKRRLELRAEIAGIAVVEDFAHHPTAIRETLRALRESYPGCRLWAVLEPRSNTLRRNVFQQALVESLSLADRVVVAEVFQSASVPAEERLQPEHILHGLGERGVPAAMLADAEAIVLAMTPQLQAGDVVAILSNGGFGGIYDKLPAAMRARFGATSDSVEIDRQLS